MTNTNNHLEVFETPEGTITFDHSKLITTAEWNNGEKETWSARGYSYTQKLKSFYMLTDQWGKVNRMD